MRQLCGGEDDGGVWFPYIMEALKNSLIEREVSENQYHNIDVKRDEFNEELFFESIHEGSQASEHKGYCALTAAINCALDEEHKR